MHTITLKNGSKYACNQNREGLFYRRDDGTWAQMAGNGDTPKFRNPAALKRYLVVNFPDYEDGGKYPRMVNHSANWD